MSNERAGRLRQRLLALGLSLGASFLLLEGLARWKVGAPLAERLPLMSVRANPFRGWEMVPGEHYTYQHLVHVNSLGFRGPELEPKAPGEVRILFLGDSLTYGQGVAEDETVPAALERELRARRPEHPWSVVNAGNRAYGTGQELGLLAELGERVEPDVVLLGWYWNDVSERPIQATYEAFLARGEFAFDTNSRLVGLAALRWHAEQLPRKSAFVMLLHDLFSTKGGVYAPEIAESGFRLLERLLERFREQGERLSAVPVLVLFPDAHRLEGGEDTRPYDERAAALARERGLPVIELLSALVPLRETSGRLPILAFDGHYDGTANRAMGAYLAEQLLALEALERLEPAGARH